MPDNTEVENSLRKLVEEYDKLKKLNKVFLVVGIPSSIAAIIFPPLGLVALLFLVYLYFRWWKHSQSRCPRCNAHYFWFIQRGFVPVNTNSRGWKCRKCKLAVNELPELEDIRPKSHTNEWLN